VLAAFPSLRRGRFEISSRRNGHYNCIAWAAGIVDAWWWPIPPEFVEGQHWPEGVPRERTLASFQAAFETLGYVVADDHACVEGVEKVAIFANADGPTHASYQLPDSWWTSKLGEEYDIRHATLEDLHGRSYGSVASILERCDPATYLRHPALRPAA
jgi:hypothetical protein